MKGIPAWNRNCWLSVGDVNRHPPPRSSEKGSLMKIWLVVPTAASSIFLIAACGFHLNGRNSSATSVALPDFCSSAKVIDRPFIANASPVQRFKYRYKIVSKSQDLPTIVYLPGGPGDTSLWLADNASTFKEFFPDGFNVMLTEPRGVGCNQLPDVIPDGTLATREIAADIASAIEQEHLTHFIVFGWSYGTVLATTLSSMLEERGLTPTAYVLQGTMGKHFGDSFDSTSGFSREWKKLKSALPQVIASQFSKDPLPLGIGAKEWATFIAVRLQIRNAGEPSLATSLATLQGNTTQQEALKAEIIAMTSGGDTPRSAAEARLYNSIMCSELDLAGDTDEVTLSHGELVFKAKPSACPNKLLLHPFNSVDYQMSAPIFYVQGDNDPSTTIENAKYHFEGQHSVNRAFITVEGGTHYPFAQLDDCRDAVWKSFALSGQNLSLSLKNCRTHTTLEMKNADKNGLSEKR